MEAPGHVPSVPSPKSGTADIEEGHSGHILPELEITMHEVMEQLTKLKEDKSPGPDGMHPLVLHKISNHIQEPGTYRGHHQLLRGRRLFKVEKQF